MTRVALAEALRIYNLKRGMSRNEADLEARRLRAWVLEMCNGERSADIHLNDFYFVALEEGGEYYLDRTQLDAALKNLRERQSGKP